jgi:CheY-like chemotaxis protein
MPDPKSPEPDHDPRVLVVDDDPDSADLLSAVLARIGYEALAAHDAVTALAIAHTWRPEIVVLDLMLPGMDGYELAAKLRADPGLRTTRIIALTGSADDERTRDAGFDAHLVKGVKLEELIATIDVPTMRAA